MAGAASSGPEVPARQGRGTGSARAWGWVPASPPAEGSVAWPPSRASFPSGRHVRQRRLRAGPQGKGSGEGRSTAHAPVGPSPGRGASPRAPGSSWQRGVLLVGKQHGSL